MDPRMRELVSERLEVLRARLPAGVTLDAFLWESDLRDEIMPRDWEIAAAYDGCRASPTRRMCW